MRPHDDDPTRAASRRTPARTAGGRAATLLAATLTLALGACSTTPRTLEEGAIDARATADYLTLFEGMTPPRGALSLPEAIARAIKYNLDNRLKAMESVVAERHLDLVDFDRLPTLAARAGYTARNKVHASSSFNLDTGVPNFGASTSQDETIFTADLELAWNTLDVGIAWIDARQAGDEAMIAVERQRKATANVVRDVRDAYWRLVSAERLAEPLIELKRDIRRGLADSYAAQRAKLKPIEECLEDQRALLDLQRQVLTLQRGAEEARVELAAMIGLPPGTFFEVDTDAELVAPYDGDAAFEIDRLRRIALRNRPELIEEDYRTRIAADEVFKARWRWVPGFELFAGVHHDDNGFLLHNDWAAAGYRMTWNLLNVFSTPAAVRLARSRQELGELRRLALGMAVVTQVDIAVQRLEQAREEYDMAAEMRRVDGETLEQFRARASVSRIDGPTLLRARARDVVSRLRHTIAFAERQSAAANLYASIGYEPTAVFDADAPLETLVEDVEALLDVSDFETPASFYVPAEATRRSRDADDYDGELGDDDALSRIVR